MSNTPIRLLIVDDHPLMRLGLVYCFQDESDIAVIGEAEDGCEAIKMARTCQPDVILMNYMMPCMDGITATKHILAELPHTKIIIHSIVADMIRLEAWESGAKGALRVNVDVDEWLNAVRAVYHGQDGRTRL